MSREQYHSMPRGADVEESPQQSAVEAAKFKTEAMEEMREFLKKYQYVLRIAAGDSSLRFEPHEGKGFYFDLKAGVVYLSATDYKTWKEKKGATEMQMLWIANHEIGHFRDLRENPEAMERHFNWMWDKAHELSVQALGVIRRKHGDAIAEKMGKTIKGPGGREVSAIQNWLYGKLHMLYNCLDDMYVNQGIPSKAAIFDIEGTFGHEVASLYQKILFPPDAKTGLLDYSKMPKSHQFAYYLLRGQMVPNETITIAPDVAAVIQGAKDIAAKKLGLTLRKEILNTVNFGNEKNRDPGVRYEKLTKLALNPYVKFLMEDLEQEPPKQEQDQQSGSGEKGEQGEQDEEGQEGEGGNEGEEGEDGQEGQSGKESRKNGKKQKGKKPEGTESGQGGGSWWDELDQKPEGSTPDQAKDFRKQAKEKADQDAKEKAEAAADAAKTPEQRQDDMIARQDRAICRQEGIPEEYAIMYRRDEKLVEPFRRELEEVFEKILTNITKTFLKSVEGFFTSGKADIGRYIEKHAIDVISEWEGGELTELQKMEIYTRLAKEMQISLRPNRIQIWLNVDASRSMGRAQLNPNDDPKLYEDNAMTHARRAVVLIQQAITDFEMTINARFKLKEPFQVDLGVIIWGDTFEVVQPLGRGMTEDQDMAARIKGYGAMQGKYETTLNAPPLKYIKEQISAEDEAALKKGAMKLLIINLTDGACRDAASTHSENAQLDSRGAAPRSLFIAGAANAAIPEEFKLAWGVVPTEKTPAIGLGLGAKVGAPSEIGGAMGDLLQSELLKIKFQAMVAGAEDAEPEE